MYIKVVNKYMKSDYNSYHGFELNKLYKTKYKIKLRDNGFHYCDNLNDTLYFYTPDAYYFEVKPSGKILQGENFYCSEEITLIRKLDLDELISLDKSGEWCYYYIYFLKNNLEKIQQAIIEKDISGRWCYELIQTISGVNKDLLMKALREKDKEKIFINEICK